MKAIWLLSLSIWMTANGAWASGTCSSSIKKMPLNGNVYACDADAEAMEFCSYKRASGCKKVDFSSAEDRLRDQISSHSGYAGRKVLRSLQRQDNTKKRALLAFIDLVDWRKNIRVKSDFVIQTGPYGKLQLSEKIFDVRCLSEIMQAAYLLETHFPKISFEIDGGIKECKNLNSGVAQLIENKSRVKQNIAKFHSPMHTVFLTTQTKFNNFLMGKMGLYVNVNRSGEIPNRLIEFRVGEAEINHETTSL
jgi:hypothetical protein